HDALPFYLFEFRDTPFKKIDYARKAFFDPDPEAADKTHGTVTPISMRSLGFTVNLVCVAPRAVLPELQPVRMRPFVFGRCVVPLRTFGACQSDDHTHGEHLLIVKWTLSLKECIPTKLYHITYGLSILAANSTDMLHLRRQPSAKLRFTIMHRMRRPLNGFRGCAAERTPSSRPPDLPQKKGLPPGLGRRGRHQAPTKDAMKRRHPAENRLSAQDSLPCWNRRPSFFTISFVKRGGNCGLVSNESITKQGEVADRTKGATWTSNGEPG